MAFRARTITHPPNEPNAYASRGPNRVADGLALTCALKTFTGKPSKTLLEDDCVLLETMCGDAYPNSSADRNAMNAGRMRMHLKQVAGTWPTAREKQLDAFAERKLAHAEDTAMQMYKQQGMSLPDAKRAWAESQLDTQHIPILDPPKQQARKAS